MHSGSSAPPGRRGNRARRLCALAVAALLAACAPAIAPDADVAVPEGRNVTVERVVDGDTLVVDGGERVRLLGVDTPEVEGPHTRAECGGAAASAYTRSLVPPGTQVRLVADISEVDRFGRTLAYVYRRSDGRMVNLALVEEGHAEALPIEPDVRHADRFETAEAEADRAGSCDGESGG